MPIGDNYIVWTRTSYALLPQSKMVICDTPPACALEITNATASAPTLRGDDDGSITVTVTGATGATINYIFNGVPSTGPAAGKTFTGLEAGLYDVYVYEGDCADTYNDILVPDGEFRTGDFLTAYPVGLVAVENPVIIRVMTHVTNPVSVQGVYRFYVSNDIPDGYNVKFVLTSPFAYEQTFYAKGYPDKPNYFLASILTDEDGNPVGTNTHPEINTSFAEALSKDAVLSKVYNINTIGTISTYLTAKEGGTKYALESGQEVFRYNPAGTLVTTGFTFGTMTTAVDFCDGQLTDNYSIACEVYANTDLSTQYPETGQSTDFNKVAELVLPFDINNLHKFDISTILKLYVNTPVPNAETTGVTYLPSFMQPYFCRLYELYPLVTNTNTIKKRSKTTTDVQWAINSSLDRFSENNMQSYIGEYLTNLNPNFTLSHSWVGGWSGSATYTMEDYLIYSGLTGMTTGIKFSVWDSTNTSILYPWQDSNIITGITAGTHYVRISGSTSGLTHTVSRWVTYSSSYGAEDESIGSSPVTNVKFLTNSPNPKQIQRNSQEYLYFILQKDYGPDMICKGNLYFYDGTSSTGQTFFTVATGDTNAGGVMMMNLSYDKLGLAAYEVSGSTNRKIKRAEISIWQDDGVNPVGQYSEEKIYRFEIDEQPRKFGILFQNSLGGYDSFDFIGVVEETIDRDIGSYTMPLDYNTNGDLPQAFKSKATYNTKVTKKIICNSGWIDEDHMDWLMEMLKSNNIYSYTTTNQNYLNLIEYKYNKSSLDDLFDMEVTFEQTIYENSLTV